MTQTGLCCWQENYFVTFYQLFVATIRYGEVFFFLLTSYFSALESVCCAIFFT